MRKLKYQEVERQPNLHALGFYGSPCENCQAPNTETVFSIDPGSLTLHPDLSAAFSFLSSGREKVPTCPRGRRCFPLENDIKPGELRVAVGRPDALLLHILADGDRVSFNS